MSREPRKPRPSPIAAPDGCESVWDYPRPPTLDEVKERVLVLLYGKTIAESTNAIRILETSHPPGIYIPAADFDSDVLVESKQSSYCEWKGMAHYYDLVTPAGRVGHAAWYYPQPNAKYAAITNYISVYPGKMSACYLGDEQVEAQAGEFYGGWITSKIVGPFKGEPGTEHW